MVVTMPGNPAKTARRGPSARAALIWGLVATVGAQVALVAAADTFAPEVFDPVYAARLSRLRVQRAGHPERPLLVMVGSSRTTGSFLPEILPPMAAPDGRTVLPFNFSRPGGGPIYSRFAYERLRKQGMTPDWLVVELMPVLFEKNAERYFCPGMTAYELPELGRYISNQRALGAYVKRHLLPWRAARVGLLREFAPSWVTPGVEGADHINELGGEGRADPIEGLPDPPRTPPAPHLKQMLSRYRIDPDLGQAFRDLLRACRRNGTGVVVVLTPETEALRAAYPPDGLAELDRFCAELTREFGVRVLDARDWLPDDMFVDTHHVNLRGQRAFTTRLHREVLIPLVAGQLDPGAGSARAKK
jgi:hypothetical protein